jgi:hypothetical protein
MMKHSKQITADYRRNDLILFRPSSSEEDYEQRNRKLYKKKGHLRDVGVLLKSVTPPMLSGMYPDMPKLAVS